MNEPLMPLKHCPACTGESRHLFASIGVSNVYECDDCELRYLDPCLSPGAMSDAYESDESLQEFHDFHEGYYDYGSLDQQSKTRNDFERSLQLLEGLIGSSSDKSIFDVGFGNGFFLALAKRRGWQVQGIDTSSKNKELVQSKFGLELSAGLFEKDIPSEAIYDVVSFWDVVEHFPDPSKALMKAKEILKPGGYLLIGVPHDRSFLMVLATTLYAVSGKRFKKGLDKVYFLEHVSYYHKKPMDVLLKSGGFSPKSIFYTSTDLNKYKLPFVEKMIARIILMFGKFLGMQNRMVTIYQKDQ